MPWQLVAFSTQQLMYNIQGVLLYILKQNFFSTKRICQIPSDLQNQFKGLTER